MNINYETDALIVIDLQNDFAKPGGALYVQDGEKLAYPIINTCSKFSHTFFTQDSHPTKHISFASSHEGKKPFDTIELYNHSQMLWPDHCVIGTSGADIVKEVDFCTLGRAKAIIRKGMNSKADSYSAFRENYGPNGKPATTGFASMLHTLGIKRTFFCGLARDYCVLFSALDAVSEGFEVYVINNLTKSVNPSPEAVKNVSNELTEVDVKLINYNDIGL